MHGLYNWRVYWGSSSSMKYKTVHAHMYNLHNELCMAIYASVRPCIANNSGPAICIGAYNDMCTITMELWTDW